MNLFLKFLTLSLPCIYESMIIYESISVVVENNWICAFTHISKQYATHTKRRLRSKNAKFFAETETTQIGTASQSLTYFIAISSAKHFNRYTNQRTSNGEQHYVHIKLQLAKASYFSNSGSGKENAMRFEEETMTKIVVLGGFRVTPELQRNII